MEFRKISSKNANGKATDLVMPEHYDDVLKAAKTMTSFKGPRDIERPLVFRKIGYCLSNLCVIVRGLAHKSLCKITLEKCRSFTELYKDDWSIHAGNAVSTHNAKKANVPEELPDEDDVKKLRLHLVSEMQRLTKLEKTDKFTWSDYKDLLNITLARVMSFNARRGGEVARMKLTHWKGVLDNRWKRRKDFQDLDDVEKKIAERLSICYVEGKKKRKSSVGNLVPILFTPDAVEAIKALEKRRAFAGITEKNSYLFPRGEMYVRGWDALQGIAKKIEGLNKPKLLTPSRTRKYLSTLLQLLDMNDAELTWITNHMGHTKDIHLNWYRKEDATLELTKVAKVLYAVDRGDNLKNMRIDDLGTEHDSEEPKETRIKQKRGIVDVSTSIRIISVELYKK
ncbi:uncharacterized protein [Clytia hemisphaerica]|uniref:uncharacterized protein n=1 Tax=Clytia hemisphaerica TaxID=252671 RepID=UPI0034D69E2B